MTRVLIVDDSALVRRVLSEELGKFPDIEVVGTATDPYAAREQIVRLQPDVVTLDVEMPRMDGLSFLARLMKHYPVPVVVVSSVTPERSEFAVRALALGAIDVVCKPASSQATPEVAARIVQAIRAGAEARPRFAAIHAGATRPTPGASLPAVAPSRATPGSLAAIPARAAAPLPASRVARVEGEPATLPPFGPHAASTLLAVGASTGGTQAIERLLRALPADAPPTVIVQHMPEHFTLAFAQRLDRLCAVSVREAVDGETVERGAALIAPGNRHLLVTRDGGRWIARVKDGPMVHHQRPAVDVLFQSVARHAGRHAVGVLLTGMGADGARGLLTMRECGARTIAQDEASCVVFGMPREAIRLGAADEVLPLDRIAARVGALVSEGMLAHA